MTTATGVQGGRRSGAARCGWSVLVALFAVFAVLVHHDTTSVATPARVMRAMSGMDHTAVAASPAATSAGQGPAHQVVHAAMEDHSGACSGAAMQHCSSGDVGTAKLVVPPSTSTVDRWDAASNVSIRRGLPDTSHRAPPDLSVLSRLLI